MLPYWDAYYFDLALAHRVTRVHGAGPSSHRGAAWRHQASWFFLVAVFLGGLATLAQFID